MANMNLGDVIIRPSSKVGGLLTLGSVGCGESVCVCVCACVCVCVNIGYKECEKAMANMDLGISSSDPAAR